LRIDETQLEFLGEVSDYNLESRYPDDKFGFYKKCTSAFTKENLRK